MKTGDRRRRSGMLVPPLDRDGAGAGDGAPNFETMGHGIRVDTSISQTIEHAAEPLLSREGERVRADADADARPWILTKGNRGYRYVRGGRVPMTRVGAVGVWVRMNIEFLDEVIANLERLVEIGERVGGGGDAGAGVGAGAGGNREEGVRDV